jgi:hypothetical protein
MLIRSVRWRLILVEVKTTAKRGKRILHLRGTEPYRKSPKLLQ